MPNPTAQVASACVPFEDTRFYWPLIGGDTVATTYQTGEMIGLRSDGYAGKFDDSASMKFLGVLEGLPIVMTSDDTAGSKQAKLVRPHRLVMPLASGTVTRASNIGANVYASTSGTVTLSSGSYANTVGNLVDVISTTGNNLTGSQAVIEPCAAVNFGGNTGTSGAITVTSITGDTDPLNLRGLAGVTSTAGGLISAVGGAGGTTSAGGAIVATGGAGGSSSGSGGAVTLTGGAGTAGNAAGGVASLTGGAGQGSSAGAISRIVGGAGGATGAGGAAQVTGGAGGATSGTGGAATIVAGAGTAGNSAGGVASMAGGAGQGTGAGGATSVTGGASGAGATGNGGAASLVGGAALSTNGSGGAASITGGVATGTGTGGAVALLSGASAGASGTAGNVTIDCGAAAGGTAGAILIGGTNAGSTKIGTGSEQAAIKAINISGTVAVTVPSITDPDIAKVDVDISAMTFAAAVGDAVIAIPLEALPSNCRLQGAWVSATDTVTITFGSEGGNVTGAAKNFRFLLIDLT